MPTRWYYHYCWAWSSILKVLKVIGLQISLQYLKKEDMKGVHFLHAAEHQSFYKLGLLLLMEVARFYGGPSLFIVTCFLAQPGSTNFLPEHCNTLIKQQLCGGKVAFAFALNWCFSREAGYIAANHPMSIKQARKSLHQALISPKVLQKSTTILQLKVYISYVVQKLVGHSP